MRENERRDYEETIVRLMGEARTDKLTGLGNYQGFREYCENLAGLGVPFSVVLFDLTNLKRANDTLGHFGADTMLNKIGRVIRLSGDRRTEGNDLGFDAAFRHGGDEFAVVLPCCPVGGALNTLTRIEQAIGVSELPDGSPVRAVGAVAHMPPNGDLDAELNRADKALENRKRAWKDATQPGHDTHR